MVSQVSNNSLLRINAFIKKIKINDYFISLTHELIVFWFTKNCKIIKLENVACFKLVWFCFTRVTFPLFKAKLI